MDASIAFDLGDQNECPLTPSLGGAFTMNKKEAKHVNISSGVAFNGPTPNNTPTSASVPQPAPVLLSMAVNELQQVCPEVQSSAVHCTWNLFHSILLCSLWPQEQRLCRVLSHPQAQTVSCTRSRKLSAPACSKVTNSQSHLLRKMMSMQVRFFRLAEFASSSCRHQSSFTCGHH